jgi:hypothetical protein
MASDPTEAATEPPLGGAEDDRYLAGYNAAVSLFVRGTGKRLSALERIALLHDKLPDRSLVELALIDRIFTETNEADLADQLSLARPVADDIEREIDETLERIKLGIARETEKMDDLLARLRNSRVNP